MSETPTPEEMLSAALAYARQGRRVHPLRAGTKIPRLNDWPEKATTSAKTIKSWWRKWPTSNIGIATGAASNLWVLDVDLGSHPEEARETMGELSERGYRGHTTVINTPSGGVHYWHAWPKGDGEWTNAGGNLIRKNGGIDVRAEGGQVAAAPSVILNDNKGKPYKGGPRPYVSNDAELNKVPKWLAKLTRQPKAPPIVALAATPYDVDALSDRDRERVASWLETTTGAIAAELEALKTDPAAQWDNEVFLRAQRLVDLANADWSPLTLDNVRALLLAHAPRDSGFPDARVLAKLKSAIDRATALLPLPIRAEPTLATFDFPKKIRPQPEAFFNKQIGLLADKLAKSLNYDLGLGPDGSTWVYGGGVWIRADDEIERRTARALGDRYRVAFSGLMRSIITKSYDLPILTGSPDSRYINTTTGMLDWQTGELLEHNIAYLSTVQLPVPYDTAATCPNFDAWLAEVIPPENMDLAWEIIGYMVMSGNPLHQAVLLHGDGGNGKSTFLRVLVALLGKHNTSSVTLRNISEGKFETAGLFGKIANVAGDIDSKYLGDTSTFKAITGSDIIETQHKYGHPFTFVPWAVPIFSANETWRSSDTTEGYFRRWTTLPFPNKVIGQHGAVFDESALFMETPGILVKAVASLRTLMARGSFEMLGMAADLKREFEHESDVVQVWLREDERVVRHDAGNTTDRTERPLLYRRYADWSKDNGHTALNSTNFYKRLTRIGFLATRGANARYILGIHLDIFSAHLDMANAFATPEGSAD